MGKVITTTMTAAAETAIQPIGLLELAIHECLTFGLKMKILEGTYLSLRRLQLDRYSASRSMSDKR